MAKPPRRAVWVLTPDLVSVGRKLKSAREELRLSYREVAALSGVSPSHILRIESGEFDYSVDKFCQLASALGLSPAVLLESNWHCSDGMKISPAEIVALVAATIGIPADPQLPDDDAKLIILRKSLALMARLVVLLVFSADRESYLRSVKFSVPEVRDAFTAVLPVLAASTHTAERFAFLEAMEENPSAKLRSLGLISATVMKALWDFEWSRENEGAVLLFPKSK